MIALAILAPIAAMVVQMTISRRNEFEADEGGARICGNPLALASALRKIEMIAQRQPMHVSPSAAHMAIINPLAGARQGFGGLFRTHPPTEDRIARLEQLHAQGGPGAGRAEEDEGSASAAAGEPLAQAGASRKIVSAGPRGPFRPPAGRRQACTPRSRTYSLTTAARAARLEPGSGARRGPSPSPLDRSQRGRARAPKPPRDEPGRGAGRRRARPPPGGRRLCRARPQLRRGDDPRPRSRHGGRPPGRREGYASVIAVGGDGTVGEVITGTRRDAGAAGDRPQGHREPGGAQPGPPAAAGGRRGRGRQRHGGGDRPGAAGRRPLLRRGGGGGVGRRGDGRRHPRAEGPLGVRRVHLRRPQAGDQPAHRQLPHHRRRRAAARWRPPWCWWPTWGSSPPPSGRRCR
jgi:hypothetical protein